MTRFKGIREAALEYWAAETGREIRDQNGALLLTDDFVGAYECDWQNGYRQGHVHLFYSLGDWACNLTDMLKDDRFDELDLENEAHAQVLFRHYTRILLIISELLTDFQDTYIHAAQLTGNRQVKNQAARAFYFPTTDRINQVLNYINHVCKHKTQHLHTCNNHLPIHFSDAQARLPRLDYLSLEDSDAPGKNAVKVPELMFLIQTVIICYRRLNSYFRQNRANYRQFCTQFSQ
jgi:hypothetical protein